MGVRRTARVARERTLETVKRQSAAVTLNGPCRCCGRSPRQAKRGGARDRASVQTKGARNTAFANCVRSKAAGAAGTDTGSADGGASAAPCAMQHGQSNVETAPTGSPPSRRSPPGAAMRAKPFPVQTSASDTVASGATDRARVMLGATTPSNTAKAAIQAITWRCVRRMAGGVYGIQRELSTRRFTDRPGAARARGRHAAGRAGSPGRSATPGRPPGPRSWPR